MLVWINRIEMANSSLSLSCDTFKKLCWPKLHMNVKPHKILPLQIFSARYELGIVRAVVQNWNDQIMPIPSIQPPEYIVGISKIDLKFVDLYSN